MASMIIDCAACSSQNFLSAERRAVREIHPCCWKCGKPLPVESETGSAGGESKKGARNSNTPGSKENG